MRDFAPGYTLHEQGASKEPRFVLKLSWDDADTEHTYFTSSENASIGINTDASLLSGTITSVAAGKLNDTSENFNLSLVSPGMWAYNTTTLEYAEILTVESATQLTLGRDIFQSASPLESYEIYDVGEVIHNCLTKISGQTQKINPELATSTIGSISAQLVDVSTAGNDLLQSEDFNTTWTLGAVTAAQDAVAPDGSTTAWTLTDTSGGAAGVALQTITVSNNSNTRTSVLYFKQGTATSSTLNLSFSGGTSKSATIVIDWTTTPPTFTEGFGSVDYETLPDGWYRLSVRIANNGTGNTQFTYRITPDAVVAGTGTLIVWHPASAETIAYLPYHPTTTAAVVGTKKAVTQRINKALSEGKGLRGKIARIYVGYTDMPFSDYDLRLTYIVDSILYRDGLYTLNLSDIQRQERQKIFGPDETTLATGITATSSIIPVTTSDTSLFPLVVRGSETLNFPDVIMTYVKIEDEVIAIDSQPQFDTTNGYHMTVLQRGALGTRAADHTVDTSKEDSRKPKVIEHVYLEGPAPKIIYAILTGILHHGNNKVPYPFDLDMWTASAIVTRSTTTTPMGWGKAYDINDNSAGTQLSIVTSLTPLVGDYTHGETWTISLLILKDATATHPARLELEFAGGAAASNCVIDVDIASGASTPATTNATIVDTHVFDQDDWWHVKISGYSTTTGTTVAWFEIFPCGSVASHTQTITATVACGCKGEKSCWWILPKHWHLGIHADFVRLSDFQTLGVDYWDTSTNAGRFVRIENPGSQDGKKFIEKEILLWMGAFMPIYTTGELGIRRLAGILSDSSYLMTFNKRNISSYSDMKHDMREVINDIRVYWNRVDLRDEFTKESVFIDADSISKHGTADTKEFKFLAVHTGQHTDEDLLTYFDVLRDRYSGPPLKLSLGLMPSQSRVEVGDTVRVVLDQIRDFTKGTTLDRTFEVQQVSTNWTNGSLKVSLFGSSQKAGELTRTTLNSVLDDSYYTSGGTEISTVLTVVGGVVTVSGTLTGHATSMDSGIYYYDGDLTINTGVTVTVTENVQLRIKGVLTINGNISGVGNGATAGAATTQFVGGGTSDVYRGLTNLSTALGSGYDPLKAIDYDQGEQGYFGTTIPAAALTAYNIGDAVTIQENDWFTANGVDVTFNTYIDTAGAAISQGTVDEIPFFQIKNNLSGTLLTGYPADLRGNSGGGGVPLRRVGYTFGVWEQVQRIIASGGAGGDGGAGLMIVARGMNFGGSGYIDLTGGDSSAGGSWTDAGGDKFYAGSGAPGAPGGLLILMDGDATNPDINEFNFIANYGDAVHAVGATEVGQDYLSTPNDFGGRDPYTPATWPHGDAVWNEAPTSATENNSVTASAHRLQYIPPTQGVDVDYKADWERGKFNELLFLQKTPAASEFFGVSIAITPNGERFAASDSSATQQVRIYKDVKNPYVEQTFTLPGGSANDAETMSFDAEGTRLFVSIPIYTGAAAFQGEVLVYARTTTTWALEQTITTNGTPAASDLFGRYFDHNADGDKLIIARPNQATAGNRIEYWTRSGATWSFSANISVPSGATTGWPSSVKMSGDGLWLFVGDEDWPTAGTGAAGRLHLYELVAGTWTLRDSATVPGYDNTSPITPYQLTESTSTRYGQNIQTNHDGTVVAAQGQIYDVSSPIDDNKWLHVFERQGATLKYVQGVDVTDAHGWQTFDLADMSNNGLLLLTKTLDAPGEYQVWRRGNISEGFGLIDGFKNTNDGPFSSSMTAVMAGSGQFVMVGEAASDFNAANSGHIELWEYYPEAD